MMVFKKNTIIILSTRIGILILLIFCGQYNLKPETLTGKFNPHYNIQKKRQKDQRQSFMGTVCKGDFDTNRDLVFIIKTQERPDQNYLIDNIKDQPYRFILVKRDFKKNEAKLINKIRLKVNQILENNFNKVIVFGRYTSDSKQIQNRYDGYLELTSIWIYKTEREFDIISIEDIWGVVR